MSRLAFAALAALLVLAAAAPSPARADWPETGLLVGTGGGAQTVAGLVPDNLGGVYVAWGHPLFGVLVSHVTVDGVVAPGWPISAAPAAGGSYLGMGPDGADGIALLFTAPPVGDNGQGLRTRDIYALRFAPDGQTPAGWSPAGNTLYTEAYSVMDDLGWEDLRMTRALPWSQGGVVFCVDAFRMPSTSACRMIAVPTSGAAATRWAFGLGMVGNSLYTVDSDSTGGFVVVLTASDQVSVIRYSSSGAVVSQRPVHGGMVTTFGYGLTLWPRQDALVWWTDPDFPGTWYSRLGDNLLPVTGWPGAYQSIPMTPLLADGQGGAFARVNVAGTNYVDRLSLDTPSPVSLWSPAPLPPDHGGTYVGDGQFGYFETWMPSGISTTLRSTHYGADGALRSPWPQDGVLLTSTHLDTWTSPRVVPGGGGTAFVAWEDTRAGNPDVYVQRLADNSPVPTQASLVSAIGYGDRAELEWWLPDPAPGLHVERSRDEGPWEFSGPAVESERGRWRHVDRDVHAEESVGYRLRGFAGVLAGSEAHVRIPERVTFSLRGFVTNPAERTTEVEFALVGDAPARLELLDVAGRVLASRAVTGAGAGRHRTTFADRGPIAPGMAFVRLTEGPHCRVARAVVLR